MCMYQGFIQDFMLGGEHLLDKEWVYSIPFRVVMFITYYNYSPKI